MGLYVEENKVVVWNGSIVGSLRDWRVRGRGELRNLLSMQEVFMYSHTIRLRNLD